MKYKCSQWQKIKALFNVPQHRWPSSWDFMRQVCFLFHMYNHVTIWNPSEGGRKPWKENHQVLAVKGERHRQVSNPGQSGETRKHDHCATKPQLTRNLPFLGLVALYSEMAPTKIALPKYFICWDKTVSLKSPPTWKSHRKWHFILSDF